MSHNPYLPATNPIDELAKIFSRIPGIGSRSARRIILLMLKNQESLLVPIMRQLELLKTSVKKCECGNLSPSDPCRICTDQKRDKNILCVVEDVTSMWAIERSHCFKGIYHVLDNVLSPIAGIGPNEVGLPKLIKRIKEQGIEEVLIALNPTIEGQSTAYYLSENMPHNVKVSRIGLGIPVGGELESLDPYTISAAMNGRTYYSPE